jgi:predicted HTH transcriptional regulator
MSREEQEQNYNQVKFLNGLKEFIFMTNSGYRHFFVLGKNLKDAEENFMRIDEIKRNGFNLDELPIRLEYNKEKCKDWSMDNFWANNENKISVSVK